MSLSRRGLVSIKQKQAAILVAGKRTPYGKFGGSLKKISPVELALLSANSLMADLNLEPKLIDQVIFTNVIPTTTDTLYAGRHLALKLGCDVNTPGYSINRLCGSGVQGILDARTLIDNGVADCILVAGAENMSNTPHLTYGGRFGTKYGALKSVDLLWDSLSDQYIGKSMGETAEKIAKDYGISKKECDLYSMLSHQKASKALKDNLLLEEIVKISVRNKNVDCDEHVRSSILLDDMEKLKSTFGKDGVITAGSASGIVDGGGCVLICSEKFCADNKLNTSIEVVGGSVVGVNPEIMGIGPIEAIRVLLDSSKMKVEDIDLFEINEAFASQAIACRNELKILDKKLNIWGGAIAIGHPLGATGIRISHTLARQLLHTKSKFGIASACIGGGQGIALLLKNNE